ncbi:MAG: translocation/assembly module TamB domain-containing protein [Thermoanaerobaculaceae bacterium]
MSNTRWIRVVLWSCGVALGLLLFLGFAVVVAWQLPSLRQYLLQKAFQAVRAKTGVELAAADVAIKLKQGSVSLREVRARVPGETPFLEIERLAVEVRMSSLWRRSLAIRRLVVEGVRLNLQAPLPQATPGREGSGMPKVEVEEVRVTGSDFRLPVPEKLSPYLATWEVGQLQLAGRLTQGSLYGSVRGQVRVTDRQGQDHFLNLEAKGSLTGDGRWELPFCGITGGGLEVALSGQGKGFAAGGEIELTANLGQWLFGQRVKGWVRFAAKLPISQGEGSFRLEAGDLEIPAALAFLPAQLAPWELHRGVWELTAQGRFLRPKAGLPAVTGTATIRWHDRGETLLEASLQPSLQEEVLSVAVEASLLPGIPGQRHFRGQLQMNLQSPSPFPELTSSELTITSPALDKSVIAMGKRWPGLLPPLPQNHLLGGALVAVVELSGPLTQPLLQAKVDYQLQGRGHLQAHVAGRLPELTGQAQVFFRDWDLAALHPQLSGSLTGEVHLKGGPKSWQARFTAEAHQPRWRDFQWDTLTVAGETDGRQLTLDHLFLSQGPQQWRVQGQILSLFPLDLAQLTIAGKSPEIGLEEAKAQLELTGGLLKVQAAALSLGVGPLWLQAQLPLETLGERFGQPIATWPGPVAAGPVFVQVEAPALDSCTLASLIPALDRQERFRAALQLVLQLDPSDPTSAQGELLLSHLFLDLGDGGSLGMEQLKLSVNNHQVILAPTPVNAGETAFFLSGAATLAPPEKARLEDPTSLVSNFRAQLHGNLPTHLLAPFLAGGAAKGFLDLLARVEGSPREFFITAEVDGTQAEFFWPTPYPTRLSGLRFEGKRDTDGDITLLGRGQVNGGLLELVGSRNTKGDAELQVEIQGARFRLDLGLLVQLNTALLLNLPSQGASSLTGTVHVLRGELERPLSLEREVIPFFLAPVATPGTQGGFLDRIALDVAVLTDEGVRVRNNLADLRVRWEDLRIRGTAWRPHMEGRVEVDPGGLVRVWGQTLRLDRAVATFTEDPLTSPHLDVNLTSSWEDPRISQGPAAPFSGFPEAKLATSQPPPPLPAAFLGSVAAAALSRGFEGAVQVRVEPVLIFSETDPSARLTFSRPLSPWAAFALSLDLRTAQNQTYLLDLRNLRPLPTLTAQVFTNDQGNTGVTIQQTLSWGGSKAKRQANLPRLRRYLWEAPPEIPRRKLARALSRQRGDFLPEGIASDLELELEHLLRQRGFPDAQVRVEALAVPGKPLLRDLQIRINPGEPVEMVFAGASPPSWQQAQLMALYRSGLWEEAALQDIREATVRYWRALSHPSPKVEIKVEPPSGPNPLRRVTVFSEPGPRLSKLRELRIEGLPKEDQGAIQKAFSGKVELMELIAGSPSARGYLQEILAALGWPRAQVLEVALTEDEQALRLVIQPGPREQLGQLLFQGVDPQDLEVLQKLANLPPGTPARRDSIVAAAARVASWYRGKGVLDAQVVPRLEKDPQDPFLLHPTFQVKLGPVLRVGQVAVTGTRRIKPGTAARQTGLTPGEPLRLEKMQEGRRQLLATGLFSLVRSEVQKQPDGTARVLYQVREEPSLSLAYGLRWESGQGVSTVVDWTDRSFAGQLATLAFRGLYEKNQKMGRVYLGVPRVGKTNLRPELFLERRRKTTPGDAFVPDLVEDSTRITFQLSSSLPGGWQAHLYGRWQETHIFERTDFFPLDITLTFPFLGLGMTYDTRDDQVLARRGMLLSFDLSGTSPALGADLSFTRLYGQWASFHPLGSWAGRAVTWAQSVRFGLAKAFGGQELIRSERFFAGGEYSVRGYEKDSLGPMEDLGFVTRPLGGEAMLVLNQELRLALPWDLVGTLFLDAGQVWEKPGQVELRDLALATGVGLRAQTPLGTFRLDLAFPWERQAKGFKLYLGFGSPF